MLKALCWWALGVVALNASAQEASDCARPLGWAESAVCASAELMQLHQRMQRLYDERRRALDGEAHMDLVSYQRGWLRAREECRSAGEDAARATCLRDLYQARLLQLGGATVTESAPPKAVEVAPPVPIIPNEPTLVACRGDQPSWAMDLAANSGRVRMGEEDSVRAVAGRMAISAPLKTYVWRGGQGVLTGAGEVVAMITEEACVLSSMRSKFLLKARVSLPDGNIMAGCCQRTPFAAGTETPKVVPEPAAGAPDSMVAAASGEALMAVGTRVRLRDVDGAVVALRKSARISSGNVLTRARAGSTGRVEQATIREGTYWYFVALADGLTKGWVMGDLVEPLSGRAVAAEPVAPTPPVASARVESAAPAPSSGRALPPIRQPWWRHVASYLSLIDACLEKTRSRNVRVVKIESGPNNTRLLYMRDSLKNRIACEVKSDGTARVRALDVNDMFPHESGPLFTRAPGTPLAGRCYRLEKVIEKSTRAVVGWNSFFKPGRRCK